MPGVNQLGGAQTLAHADTNVREIQPLSLEAALGAKGQQDSPADGVKAAEEVARNNQTDEDGRNQQEQKRSFAGLARLRRQADPYTGDFLSLRSQTPHDVEMGTRLSLVAMGEHRTAKQQLERAITDIFARPTTGGHAQPLELPEPSTADELSEESQRSQPSSVQESNARGGSQLEAEMDTQTPA